MFERFTERARQSVVLAQESARNLKVNYIGTEHILLGLIKEDEGIAAQALKTLGVNHLDLMHSVTQRITTPERESESAVAIPFTPRAKSHLERALREALSLGHNYIGTEHVLLGLVCNEENVAVEILRDDFKVIPDRVREEVRRMLSGPKAPILSAERRERRIQVDARPEVAIVHKHKLEVDPVSVDDLLSLAISLGREHRDVPVDKIIQAARALV